MRWLPEDLLSLHNLFVAGDRIAGHRICESLLPYLVGQLNIRVKGLYDEHLSIDAACRAVHAYHLKPTRFDPSRGLRLEIYLLWVARRNLSHALRKLNIRKRHEIAWSEERIKNVVEHGLPGGYLHIEAQQQPDEGLQKLTVLIDHLTVVERAFINMRLAGVRKVVLYARTLQTLDPRLVSASEQLQRRLVKNFWNRLMQKLKRLSKRLWP